MIRKPVHQKSTQGNKRRADTLTLLTIKIINQNDTPQHRSPTDSNDTSTDSCALQINEGNVTKEFSVSSDINQDYLECIIFFQSI